MPVVLNNADTRASELRGEAFANATLRLAARLNLEGGMAAELSRLRAAGGVCRADVAMFLRFVRNNVVDGARGGV